MTLTTANVGVSLTPSMRFAVSLGGPRERWGLYRMTATGKPGCLPLSPQRFNAGGVGGAAQNQAPGKGVRPERTPSGFARVSDQTFIDPRSTLAIVETVHGVVDVVDAQVLLIQLGLPPLKSTAINVADL